MPTTRRQSAFVFCIALYLVKYRVFFDFGFKLEVSALGVAELAVNLRIAQLLKHKVIYNVTFGAGQSPLPAQLI